jgi:spore maturation protein B
MNFHSVLNVISLWALPFIIVLILTMGLIKKVPIYEVFTEGAKDGFKVAVNIIPYLVAIIVAISMLRASGAIEMLAHTMVGILLKLNVPAEVLPVIFVRPLSGSAALGLFSDIATNLGPTSYATKLAAVMVGSSETTFYVLSVYFGSIGITKFRYALWVGLLADIIAAVASIIVCQYIFL